MLSIEFSSHYPVSSLSSNPSDFETLCLQSPQPHARQSPPEYRALSHFRYTLWL